MRTVFPNADNKRLLLLQLNVVDSVTTIEDRIETALARFGRIDVLVNNAGYGVKGILEEGGCVLELSYTKF